jgi:hypothetical protein
MGRWLLSNPRVCSLAFRTPLGRQMKPANLAEVAGIGSRPTRESLPHQPKPQTPAQTTTVLDGNDFDTEPVPPLGESRFVT